MKKFLLVVGIVLVVLVALGVGGYALIQRQASRAASALSFQPVNMSQMADGTYEGTADAGLVYVRVAVTVKDRAIQSVDILEHRNGRGAKAEAITGTMVQQNTYDVDVVSGATLSSTAIKSAVNQALVQSTKK